MVDERRTADWYELFFDLVFVVVIAFSADLVEHDPTPGTVLVFVLLLFPLWWAWVNLAITNNLFGARHPAIGILVLVATPGPAAMAVAIAGGVSHAGALYAAGAIWIRLVLLAMWLVPWARGTIAVPLWRVLTYNLGTAAIWLVSIWIPTPWQWVAWAFAVGIEVALLGVRRGVSHEVYRRTSVSHALERVGLFVVIVIGEAVYLGLTGLAPHPTIAGGAAVLGGLVVCALLARAFFRWGAPTTEQGLEDARRANSFGAMRDVVMYIPFLLVVSLTLIAASIGLSVEGASESLPLAPRVLLFAGISGFYVANALVGLRLRRSGRGIALLLAPAILLAATSCFATASLPAWLTMLSAGLALVALDVYSAALGRALGAHTH